jgi:hypothetical protein
MQAVSRFVTESGSSYFPVIATGRLFTIWRPHRRAQYPEVAEQLEQKISRLIVNGRSTPGPKQKNDGPDWWPRLYWMKEGN